MVIGIRLLGLLLVVDSIFNSNVNRSSSKGKVKKEEKKLLTAEDLADIESELLLF